MAVVMNKLAEVNSDGVKVVYGTVTPDNSFAAGGEAFDPKTIGITSLLSIHFGNVAGYAISWDASTTSPKILAHKSAGSAIAFAAADTADLSALVIPFTAIGH